MASGGNFDVVVHGMRELEQTFTKVAMKVDPVTGKALRELAKPVQQTAQTLAVSALPNIGAGSRSWSRMRIGRSKTLVYVAEKQHGSHGAGTRANIFPTLMDQALKPSLEQHRGAILLGVTGVINDLCHEAERGMYRT